MPHFAKNVVVGFGRLGGRSVGIVANQPAWLAGVLDIDASDKAARLQFVPPNTFLIIIYHQTLYSIFAQTAITEL